MRKTTFCGLAAFSGVCAMICVFEVWPRFFPSSSGCHLSRVDQDFIAIANALKMYKIKTGLLPTTSQGLDALVSEPKSGPKPRHWTQVMKRLPKDSWGTPFRYTLFEPSGGVWRWELRSAGKDGIFGSSDDEIFEDESSVALLPPEFQAEGIAESRACY
jgi:general secretion pathway protein G